MAFNFKVLNEAAISAGTKVLCQIDLNLPIQAGAVADSFRFEKTLPTLNFLKERRVKTVLLGHLADGKNDKMSLAPVYEYVKKFFPTRFASDIKQAEQILSEIKDGEFVMLENTRRFEGEKENSDTLAKEFASLGSIFVNDAFSVSHRSHASIVGIPKFIPSYAGLLFADEVSNLSKAFNPPKPFMFILAGAKFETKFPLVKKFLELADTVFLGGALANDLLKYKGYEIGLSKHASVDLGFAGVASNQKLLLPIDVVAERGGMATIKDVASVATDERIVDAGPKTLALLKEKIAGAKFVLWNGTLGAYEENFVKPTEDLARYIAFSGAESVIGGGDTLASISKLNLLDKFSFVSTGGGAMLDFLAKGTLPGITALEN